MGGAAARQVVCIIKRKKTDKRKAVEHHLCVHNVIPGTLHAIIGHTGPARHGPHMIGAAARQVVCTAIPGVFYALIAHYKQSMGITWKELQQDRWCAKEKQESYVCMPKLPGPGPPGLQTSQLADGANLVMQREHMFALFLFHHLVLVLVMSCRILPE